MDNYVFLLIDIHRLKYFYFFKNHIRIEQRRKRRKEEKKKKRKKKEKKSEKSDRPTFSIGLKDL